MLFFFEKEKEKASSFFTNFPDCACSALIFAPPPPPRFCNRWSSAFSPSCTSLGLDSPLQAGKPTAAMDRKGAIDEASSGGTKRPESRRPKRKFHLRDTKIQRLMANACVYKVKKKNPPSPSTQPCGRTLYRSQPSIQIANLPCKKDERTKIKRLADPYFRSLTSFPDSAMSVDIYENSYVMKVLSAGARLMESALPLLLCKGTNI